MQDEHSPERTHAANAHRGAADQSEWLERMAQVDVTTKHEAKRLVSQEHARLRRELRLRLLRVHMAIAVSLRSAAGPHLAMAFILCCLCIAIYLLTRFGADSRGRGPS
jgi:hypothetical protein